QVSSLILGSGSTLLGPAFDVFVDSSRPNDSGDGLTTATAKKTIAAGAALLTGGKTKLGLAKGSSWREQLTVPTGCSVGAYGTTGSAPILAASNVAANASFSASGTANAYQISWAHAITGGSTATFSVFENGARLKRVADLTTCGTTAGSFFAPTPGVSPQTIYVHPTGNTNPTND